MWNVFEMQNLGDFSDFFLKTDVLLLACVFEAFRKPCLLNFSLDTAQYFTLPSLSWDVFLKHANVPLEIIKDINIYNFFEEIQGGFSCVVK